jgi:hypothetical protein
VKKDRKTASEAAKMHIDNQERTIIMQIRKEEAAPKRR